MAILIIPTGTGVLSTTSNINLPQCYARINELIYEKTSGSVDLKMQYFQSEEAAKTTPASEPLNFRGFPSVITCPSALTILANSAGISAYSVAYTYAMQELNTILTGIATITPV